MPPLPPLAETWSWFDNPWKESTTDPPAPPPPAPASRIAFPALEPSDLKNLLLPSMESATIIIIPPPFPPGDAVEPAALVEAPPPPPAKIPFSIIVPLRLVPPRPPGCAFV